MTGIWCSGNWMSTAGPAIWMTRPSAVVVVIKSLLQSGGAAHNFDNLPGDGGLAYAVHVQREPVDYIGRISASGVHGGHAGGMLRGRGVQHGAVNIYPY